MFNVKSVFLPCYSVKYDVMWGFSWMSSHHLYSTTLRANYSSPWWSEERSCIYKCYWMFVHFWIPVGDIAWLSCIVVVYNLVYLSLPDDEKVCEASIAFLFFRLISNDDNSKSLSMLVTECLKWQLYVLILNSEWLG